VATEKEEREGIQSTITQFEKLLNEFVTSGANMDPNVLRQWVNEFDIVAADGFVLALDKENKPKLACVEALTSLCVLDELSETMPIILENCLYKLNTEEISDEGKRLSYDERLAISVYTYDLAPPFHQQDNFYYVLNKYLRERALGGMASAWRPYIYYFQSALSKLPSHDDITVYRGVDASKVDNTSYNQGKMITWTGYTSCSLDRESTIRFSQDKGMIFEIHAKRGKDISGFSWFPLEKEMLLSPNSKFLVVKPLHKINGQDFITLEEFVDTKKTFIF